jgi:hypothetical protein
MKDKEDRPDRSFQRKRSEVGYVIDTEEGVGNSSFGDQDTGYRGALSDKGKVPDVEW